MTKPRAPRRREIREGKQHSDRYRTDRTADTSIDWPSDLQGLTKELQAKRGAGPVATVYPPTRTVREHRDPNARRSRPTPSNYQPHRRPAEPTSSRYCDHCPAAIHARWVNSNLVSVAIVHLHRCPVSPGLQVEQPLADW